MTNFEKLVKDGFDDCRDLDCALYRKRMGDSCIYLEPEKICGECRCETWQWLQQEYEPPLLENGDGLKAGEIIEVFSGDGWSLREFLTYYNGLFWCISRSSTCGAVGWERARLPEEGE